MYFNARYNSSYCRHQYGLAQSNTKKKKGELDKAKLEIRAFASICGDIDAAWWDKFDKLYRQVQTDLGEDPLALVKPKQVVHSARPKLASGTKTKKAKRTLAQPDEPEGLNVRMIAFAIILFAGGGIGIFFMVQSQNKRPGMAYAANVPEMLTTKKRTAGTKTQSAASAQARAKGAPRKSTKQKPSKPKPQ